MSDKRNSTAFRLVVSSRLILDFILHIFQADFLATALAVNCPEEKMVYVPGFILC